MAAVMNWQATAAAPTGLSEEQAAYRDAARDFALAQLGPHAAHWDAQCVFPREAIALAGELGFCGLYVDEAAGGSGLTRLDAAIVFEELAMLGATRLVRVGTCGGLKAGMRMGDTVIAISATAEDPSPLRVAQVDALAPTATFELAEYAARLSRESGATVHAGPVITSAAGSASDPVTASAR